MLPGVACGGGAEEGGRRAAGHPVPAAGLGALGPRRAQPHAPLLPARLPAVLAAAGDRSNNAACLHACGQLHVSRTLTAYR